MSKFMVEEPVYCYKSRGHYQQKCTQISPANNQIFFCASQNRWYAIEGASFGLITFTQREKQECSLIFQATVFAKKGTMKRKQQFRSFIVGASSVLGFLLAVCHLSNRGSVDAVVGSSNTSSLDNKSYSQSKHQGFLSLSTSAIKIERRSLKGMMKKIKYATMEKKSSMSMMMTMTMTMNPGKGMMGSKGSKVFLDPCVSLEESSSKGKSKGKGKGKSNGIRRPIFESDKLTSGNDRRALSMGKSGDNSKGMMMMKKKKKSGSKGNASKGKSASVPTLFCSEAPSVVPSISSAPSVSAAPSSLPSVSPTDIPTKTPSESPSMVPSKEPSDQPSAFPSASPTASPSATPTSSPSALPSVSPTTSPSSMPTVSPSSIPSASPTASPSAFPTASPSAFPTANPSVSPTAFPTVSAAPSSPEPAQFVLLGLQDRGECRVSGNGQCIFSDEGTFADPYPAFGSCTFELTRMAELNVIGFSLADGDSLTIGANVFTGSAGPDGFVVQRGVDIVFSADINPFNVAEGFVICIAPP